jgi:GTP-binding protein EngB required for normal cell division
LFVATDDTDEEMGGGDSLISSTALPTPTTPTTPGKRFRAGDVGETDIITKLAIGEDGTVATYDAFKIEGQPHLAYYCRSFPKVEELVTKVATIFLEAADQQATKGFQHIEIFNICKEDLVQLLKVQDLYPKFGPVALLGPAGAGKCSLINALLHEAGIAIESDGVQRGAVRTWFPNSLRHTHDKRQGSRWRCLSMTSRKFAIWVQRHCKHIFECLKKIDDLDGEEGDALQVSYTAGIEFFMVLLCDMPDFRTKQDAMEYFEARQTDPIRDVVEHLTGLIEDFKQTRALAEGVEYHDTENAEGLAEIFRRVACVPRNKDPTPHPWPIITKIQIRFDNELFKAGLVIGDTPGMTDGNQDVVNATNRYLDGASVVLLVEEKKRLTANKTLDMNLRECLWRRKHGDNIQLVLTAIDKTDGKISHHKRADLSPEDLQELEEAEGVVSKLQAASASMLQQKTALMANESMITFDDLRRLDRELSDMPIRIKHAQAKVKQVAVKISIRKTEIDVKAKLRDFGREREAPNLAVHGVSNKDYQAHRAG